MELVKQDNEFDDTVEKQFVTWCSKPARR